VRHLLLKKQAYFASVVLISLNIYFIIKLHDRAPFDEYEASEPLSACTEAKNRNQQSGDSESPELAFHERGPNGEVRLIQFKAFTKKIDINSASKEVLEILPGVGAATAELIVTERTLRGPFKSIDDLERVMGMGPKVIEKLKPMAVALNSDGIESP
jgi:competence ComEA-like helix-hairpin-helix protein